MSSLVAGLLGVTIGEDTASQMTYDLRRWRLLKGLIFRPPLPWIAWMRNSMN